MSKESLGPPQVLDVPSDEFYGIEVVGNKNDDDAVGTNNNKAMEDQNGSGNNNNANNNNNHERTLVDMESARATTLTEAKGTTTTTPGEEHSLTRILEEPSEQRQEKPQNDDEIDVVVVVDDDGEEAILALMDPPVSCGELLRDSVLRKLDKPFFQWLGIVVLVLVVADGAFFFFLLMGWQTLCRPRTDCNPRNWWYNWSIQMLNVLFTYMAAVSSPWRVANFLHLSGWSCPHRSNELGRNLYGLPDPQLWFHLPLSRRLGITLVLLLNCVFQFFNQGTRLYFYNFSDQDTSPGNIWTNVFFAASFICAGIGGVWMGIDAARIRKAQPEKFGNGPIDALRELCRRHFGKCADEEDVAVDGADVANGGADGGAVEGGADIDEPSPSPSFDPTREKKRRSVICEDRAAMRMWAL